MVKNKDEVYSRGWIVVINNYTQDDVDQVLATVGGSAYAIFGYEVGEQGTPHLQGYIYYKSDCSFSSLKKKLRRAHLEAAKGTAAHNYRYCSKDGNLLIEHGTAPKQGKRSDIDHLRSELKKGANMRDVIDFAPSYQTARMGELWLKYNEKPRDFSPDIRWYHGSTGMGKTRAAIEWLGPDYYTPVSFKWWEGYDAHENVLIDEIRSDFCRYHEFLRLLDRYQYRVECKGGSRQFLAKRIAITSPYHPKDVFNTTEDITQLTRRISSVTLLGEVVSIYRFKYDDDELDAKLNVPMNSIM